MRLTRPHTFTQHLSWSVAMFCAVLATFGTINNAAADVKIATVDMARILNESEDAKAKKKQLDEFSAQARKKVDTKKSALKELESSLTKQRNEADTAKFREQAREFERLVKDEEDELRSKFVTVNRELTQKALTEVKKYAAEENLDLVLDKSSVERGTVLYSMGKVDITDAVLERIND